MAKTNLPLPGVPVASLSAAMAGAGDRPPAVHAVTVTVPQATLGTRVYLEERASAGPPRRLRALALPCAPNATERSYRAELPRDPRQVACSYTPVAVFGAREVRGEPVRVDRLPQPAHGSEGKHVDASRSALAPRAAPRASLELLAHVRAELPRATSFGRTPEGVRTAFYIADGRWDGPHIRARYRSEGGDWLLVRPDGVGIPNARATLETDDGALLYYQLTGMIELGPNGCARSLANDLPERAPLSVVATIHTAAERWAWLNRLTIVGAGTVQLKTGLVVYDVYSLSPVLSALDA